MIDVAAVLEALLLLPAIQRALNQAAGRPLTDEYKRRQAPVGIRITHRAFGRDWRYPITSKFRA